MSGTVPRRWRALCPQCGAPVDFQSAASASAVCGYCRATLVREGEALRRIGTSAEIVDDHTPLQLQASGRLDGAPFTLVGRLQMGTADGPWNEWRALFDEGREGWLSEDNGRYVFVFDAPAAPADAPPLDRVVPGAEVTVDGRRWSVASRVEAALLAAEGELRDPPPSDRTFTVVDVRNAAGEVGTLAADSRGGVGWSVGRSVSLADLKLAGLRESSEKALATKGFPCPHCGAPIDLVLATAQSVTCPQCRSIVDLSKGIGADLAYYRQENPPVDGAGPRLPLGAVGRIALGGTDQPWQVLGYVERCELDDGSGDVQSVWHEYLLLNPTEGFAFLVETEDGWSWVRTLTGVPSRATGGDVSWNGHDFSLRWQYASVVTYVLGEFYWRVERDQRTSHADYEGIGAARGWQLNREATGHEVTWSGGARIDGATVMAAFPAPAPGARGVRGAQAMQAAAGSGGTGDGADGGGGGGGSPGPGRPGPLPPDGGGGPPDLGVALRRWAFLIILVLVVLLLIAMCSRDRCQDEKAAYGVDSLEYRSCRASSGSGVSYGTGYGGSYGGYSSGGGGHK